MLRAALKLQNFVCEIESDGVPTHIMLRAALKRRKPDLNLDLPSVPTHIMLRAALSRFVLGTKKRYTCL